MDPRSGNLNLWLIAIATCVGIISWYISGVACDVPDDVVYTDVHKTVKIGDSVILTCQFRGTPSAVYWKKGDDPVRAPTLVSWNTGDPVTGECVGERPCQIMEMNAEFSLIIKEVGIAEEGLYVCRVANYKGKWIHNFTDIRVFAPPKKPYPIINECQIISPTDTETTCTISTSHSVEISCSASRYYPYIELHLLHHSAHLDIKDKIEVTNLDGTKNKTLYAIATASDISYICFAYIPGLQEQGTATVLVNLPTSSSPMPTGPTIVAKVAVPVIFILLLAVICISIILRHRKEQQRSQGTYMYAKVPSEEKIDGILSYFELENLVKEFDIGSLSRIVAELIEDSKGELVPEPTKADLYKYLCKWKESSSGSAILLYNAMEKNKLDNELQIVEDFLASTDNAVSDDDLEHICWHVHSYGEKVQPIVDALSSTNTTSPAHNDHISAPSRCDEIRDDLQIMKGWKAMSAATTYRDEDEHCDETVTFRTKSEGIRFKSKHTESMPSNQMIQLCRALEKAGRTTGDSNGQVYHQLSKTFFKIRGEYKSELTEEVLKKFALSITKRHCQRLGNNFGLSKRAIANMNEEDLKMFGTDDLKMFGTDDMLKAWVQDQKCSNYEIRRRLRQAAEQCNRQYIADDFIRKEQSEVMPSSTKLRAYLTITNENQSPGASGSKSTCLLAMRQQGNIFNVELIDLAFRLIMADVFPFAKALNISDTVLTSYRGELGPYNLTQGTANIMKQESIDDRMEMVKALEKAGYSKEARTLYCGFEISIRDMIEVENQVDKAQLAKKLGVSDDVQSTEPDNQGKGGTLLQSVLLRWRDTVHSSTFNHRLVLADALFSMGEEQLSLNIISGVYRNRVMNKPVLELLRATITKQQLPTLNKVLNQNAKIGHNCQDARSRKEQLSFSNHLLGAGFHAFAHEIMAGASEEDKKVGEKERTETENVATEGLRQGGIAINEPGEKEGKEEKATNGDTLVDNTDTEGTRVWEKDLEQVALDNRTTEGMKKANVREEEVMQEKSRDRACESTENTTENVDMKE